MARFNRTSGKKLKPSPRLVEQQNFSTYADSIKQKLVELVELLAKTFRFSSDQFRLKHDSDEDSPNSWCFYRFIVKGFFLPTADSGGAYLRTASDNEKKAGEDEGHENSQIH